MRRLPLPALHAGITCAVLLVACQSPVELPPPRQSPPPAPSVSFEIAGPSRIDAGGSFTWGAFAFGGPRGYQYPGGGKRPAGEPPATPKGRSVSPPLLGNDGGPAVGVTGGSGN